MTSSEAARDAQDTRNAMTIRPYRAREIVEDCIELLAQLMYRRTAIVALMCPPTAWGQLGGSFAGTKDAWVQQVDQVLLTLVQAHEQLQRRIKQAADSYEHQDQDVEEQYRAIRNRVVHG